MRRKNGAFPASTPLRYEKGDQYVVVTVVFDKEGDRVTAECAELGTASFGADFDEAYEAISEAISLHLNTLEDNGELQRFLDENGVKVRIQQPHWSPVSPPGLVNVT